MGAVLLAVTLILNAAGEEVELPLLIEELARHDVVFLGEEHDNTVGHGVHVEIIEGLHARRPDLVISLEMFERDVQGVVDDYLRGRIDEETFLEHSRPWGNYAKHYRPMIEFAKAKGLDVIAANVPRDAARERARGESPSGPWLARTTTAPDDDYKAHFAKAMEEHPGLTPDLVDRMYAAQCLKDDTMAESIADYLAGRPHRRPLVVHVCGKFHSDRGLGTVVRLLQRRPLSRTAVMTMVSGEDLDEARADAELSVAHYTLLVPAEPKEEEEEAAEAKVEDRRGRRL